MPCASTFSSPHLDRGNVAPAAAATGADGVGPYAPYPAEVWDPGEALSAILRCNDPELEGSWWHRKISPEIEQRVAVRYQLQRPARPWRTMSGKAFGPDQLRVAFPRNAFGSVLPLLAQHGLSFYRHTVTTTSHHDYGYNIQGLRLQVTTLFCVFFGFELCPRASLATPLAPDDEDQTTDEIPG